MAPSEPTTPVRVPKAVSTYSAQTEDPEMRSHINQVLLRDGHITKIQEQLLHTLHASPTNWPSLIQAHALTLLRSGTVHTFPELMSAVLENIRLDSEAQREAEKKDVSPSTMSAASTASVNGKGGKNGHVSKTGHGDGIASLAVPKSVIDEGVRITRESLEQVCEIVQ